MNERIWKYELKVTDVQDISMPRNAKPLYVGVQDGALVVWMLVDGDAELWPQRFCVVGTGNPIEFAIDKPYFKYVGTAQTPPHVWHVFHQQKPLEV